MQATGPNPFVRFLDTNRMSEPVKRVLMHAAFWFAWLSRTFYDIASLYNTQGAFVFTGAYLLSQLPLVYIHLYLLVPKLLHQRRYVLYALSTVALLYGYSAFNYLLMRGIPSSWIPFNLELYIGNLDPTYDVFEGAFALVISYSLKYAWMAITTKNQLLKLEKDNLQLELNALKAQVNPHFLFNTLNNIYALSMQKSDKSPEMILKLSDMMRYVLYECNTDKVPIEKEFKFIRDYIDLERIRHHERVKIDLQINANGEETSIEPFLLMPFIENSFKHGLNNRLEDQWINIKIDQEPNGLVMHVANSHEPKRINGKKAGGIGIENARRRLNLLYDKKHLLNIQPGDDR
ncbi:MAG TPA: histidine kinase, partial [Chitinophagales bacterium]|nr:histidine kinase [Chitinophagales bacterium]